MSEHWLEHAHGRIVAGDDELDVLADYGWVQITDEEREAVECGIQAIGLAPCDERTLAHADRLRGLLERLGGSDGPVTEPMPFLRRD